MARRSVLLTPGDRTEMLRKATTTDADVVVFDLEDGVHPDRKAEARETVRTALADVADESGPEVAVRVNPVDAGAARDLTVLDGDPDALMLPKVGDAAAVEDLARLLAERDATLPVLALVESAAGVLHAESIAAADPTDALLFGAEDLAGDLGATRTETGDELSHARQHVVLAARAAGVDAVDTHYPAYEDHEGLRREAERALELGYDGKMAIHPAQATIINEAFTPDDEQREWARRILDARDAAASEGSGVFVVDGEMIDAPQVRQAERILERAGLER